MEAKDIIQYIAQSEKKTDVKVYIKQKNNFDFKNCTVFGDKDKIVFGAWKDIKPVLEQHKDDIIDIVIENNYRNSAIPLLDKKEINARIEPGAIIRDKVQIGENAIIMMGAIINIGAIIGNNTMIDMGAILGGRATVGSNCHIGAGVVLAGVIEPASAKPVVVEDNVLIGANAVVIEGVHIGKNAVVGAGAVVIEDVPDNMVVVGNPARIIKQKDEKTTMKTALESDLRKL